GSGSQGSGSQGSGSQGSGSQGSGSQGSGSQGSGGQQQTGGTLTGVSQTFNFKNIFPTNSGSELSGDPFLADFKVDVSEVLGGKVRFNFKNTTTTASHFIGGAYFDDKNSLLSGILYNIGNAGTVDFGAGNGTFAQGNKIGFNPTFLATKNGAASNGVNGGESVGFEFTGNYANVIAALGTGNLNLGIHVQGLPNGNSDSFATYTGASQNVPEPLTILGSGMALGFGALFQKKRNQKNQEVK
ncbi:MAG TPA: hypothetical protein DDW51_18130, partial [Cyanobacteria bacterium UBA11367]|nr:hypothetical protein [Cyanobacteria bacterium UBA11367]HBE59354.1 hypothetical protein [Cyanobacteria bacterium UBA11366]